MPRDATPAQVRDAYYRLAKRFLPDVHHDPALSDLLEQLEQIFGRLNEAYAELSRLRERYEGGPARNRRGEAALGQPASSRVSDAGTRCFTWR